MLQVLRLMKPWKTERRIIETKSSKNRMKQMARVGGFAARLLRKSSSLTVWRAAPGCAADSRPAPWPSVQARQA